MVTLMLGAPLIFYLFYLFYLLYRRAQKPSATFLGENVAWEKSTVN
jgi:hypothetical protein